MRIPAEYRFKSDEVYIRFNPNTGELILSENPLTRSLDEIYAKLDEAGATEFVLDRDLTQAAARESL